MTISLETFDVTDERRMAEARALRLRVFVEEQGVPIDEEIDVHDRVDPAALHVLARDEAGVVVGTARFYPTDASAVRIGRMAVERAMRHRGIGARLLARLVDEATRRGFTRADLHAQMHACGFYRRAGFHDDGAQIWDAGILHQPMARPLP